MSFFKERSDYFKSIANQHKLIGHDRFVSGSSGPVRKSFHRLNNEDELSAACVNWAHFPCIVHFGYAGKYFENDSSVRKRNVLNEILILDKPTKFTDLDSVEAAKDQAFGVMEDIITYLLNAFDEEGYCSNFANLDMSMFSFTEYGPINNLVGWKLTFNDETYPAEYGSEKWYND